MLLASESMARDKSQAIPGPVPLLPNKKHISIIVAATHLLFLCSSSNSGVVLWVFGYGLGGLLAKHHPNLLHLSYLKATVISSEKLVMGSTRVKECS